MKFEMICGLALGAHLTVLLGNAIAPVRDVGEGGKGAVRVADGHRGRVFADRLGVLGPRRSRHDLHRSLSDQEREDVDEVAALTDHPPALSASHEPTHRAGRARR